jgi:uncharacterized protein YoxC
MLKKLPLLLSIISALSLAALAAYHSEVISGLRLDLSKTLRQLARTEQILESEIHRSEELSAEISLLKDSVNILNSRVYDLSSKIHGLKASIANLNEIIRKKEDQVTALSKQIEKLESNNRDHTRTIARLKQERDKVLSEMATLDTQRINVIESVKASETEKNKTTKSVASIETRINEKQNDANVSIMEAPMPSLGNWKVIDATPQPQQTVQNSQAPAIRTEEGNKMKSIIYDTKVSFQKVSVRNREQGSDLKQAKNDWKYVIASLYLENQNINNLMGEEFLIQIIDKDSGLLIPFNENNPGFPESTLGQEGYKVRFEGNPLQVKYFNSQKKDGENYEIKVFYQRNGLIFPLVNGSHSIIQRNEVVTR